MAEKQDWQTRSTRKMGLAVLVGSGLAVCGAVELCIAALTGSVDWPGRGHYHPGWTTDRPWFVIAVGGWLAVTFVMGKLTFRGVRRFRWLTRNGQQPAP